MRAILYCRVSTNEQAESGLGLAAQESRLRDECKHRGWRVHVVIRDEGISGSTIDRPGLKRALEMLAAGRADVLLVTKLDRLSRSVIDFHELLQWFKVDMRDQVKLVALDLGIDTSTAAGELVAGLMATIAQWERRVIGERTKAALAALKAQGKRTGRPAVDDHPDLREQIRVMHEDQGLGYHAICRQLNDAGVPTIRGGSTWRPSAIQSALGYKRPPRKRKPTNLPQPTRP